MITLQDDSESPARTNRPTPTGDLKPGLYQITVTNAEEHTAKSGNISLHLTLVTDGGHWLHEYIKTVPSRINPMLVCLGQRPLGAKEPLNEIALKDLRGWIRAEVEPEQNGYPAKLRVERGGWIPAADAPKPMPTGDDIPF